MVATSPAKLKRPTSYWLSSVAKEWLEQLAERRFTTATQLLEELIARAEGWIVQGEREPESARFMDRLLKWAAFGRFPRLDVKTSFSLGDAYIEGIRQLQNGLQLPRTGLVVDGLIRAAWDVEGDDDGGDGDELARRRRAGSRNLHDRRPAPVAHAALIRTPLPGQLRLLKEEHSE